MKIKTFILAGSVTIAVAGGITAAVQFQDISKQNTPFLRVLTKDTYNKMKAQQGVTNQNVSRKAVAIDYGGLPTSGVTFMDALTHKNIKGNSFIITVGSEGYKETREILYGQTSSNDKVQEINASATMLKLYDLFYNEANEDHEAIKDYADSMTFYSFIDIVYCQKTIEAENLLQYRRTQLGDKMPEAQGDETPEALIAKGYSKL